MKCTKIYNLKKRNKKIWRKEIQIIDKKQKGKESEIVIIDSECGTNLKIRSSFILKRLNNSHHYLISSVCVSKNGSMIWNYTEKAALTMKNLTDKQFKEYLSKITDETLYAYNVYQIEGEGRSLFSKIEGDENTIMGLPINKIKEYIDSKWLKNI